MEIDEERVHDGYIYVVDKRKNATTYLKCKDTRLHHCKGRAKMVANVFTLTNQHNHAADENAEIVAIFKHELQQACLVRFDRQKDIYDELRILHPDAAVIVTYPSIESSMRRWRKRMQPPIPRTLREYGDILDDPQWQRLLEYNRGRMQCATLSATDLSVSVVFGDINFIRLISDATEIFVDATYKVVPAINGAYQLLTIMATKYGHSLPFAWALMGRKSQSAYDCVLTYLRTELAPEMVPLSFMTDFEIALQTSLREIFVEAAPHGCFFHHCQAVYRKARSLHLAEDLLNNAEAKRVMKKVMALALLPADRIAEAFQAVVNAASADVRRSFAEFFAYYDRQWLRRVTPALFSVHGLVNRTNNCVESYHKVLLDKIAPHPNIWDFTHKLMTIQSAAHADLLSLREGRNVTRTPKIGYVLNNRQIVRAWEKLADGRITTAEFVEQSSNFVNNLINNLARVPGVDDQDEVELIEAVAVVPHAVVVEELPAALEDPEIDGQEDDLRPYVIEHEDPEIDDQEDDLRPNVIEHEDPEIDGEEDDIQPNVIEHEEPDAEVGGAIVISDDEEGNDAAPVPREIPLPNLLPDAAGYDTQCCVCRDSLSTHLSVPCFHLVLCSLCANQILRTAWEFEDGNNPLFGNIRCPFCNLPATAFMRVNMPEQ